MSTSEDGRDAAVNSLSFNMKVSHTLICCFFLSLVAAEIPWFSGVEGGKVTVECPFGVNADEKYFCKDPCGPDDMLIVTSQVRASRSRYRLLCVPDAPMALLVTISELKLSDSGWYRCGTNSSSFGTTESMFQIIALDAASTLTKFGPKTEAASGMLLYLVVILTVIVVILGLGLMILRKIWNMKMKNFKKRGSPLRSNAENVFYVNCVEVSNREDPIYQSLSAATMDQNQTYCSLTNTENM